METQANYPDLLWKYRRWNHNTRSLLVHGDAYYSQPSDLNDPFEYRWLEKWPTDPEELDVFIRELLAVRFPGQSLQERKVIYNRLRRDAALDLIRWKGKLRPTLVNIHLGVFCVAERFDDLLMWSHYADEHKGVCLGISTDQVRPKFFLPVRYSNKVPILDVWSFAKKDRNEFVRLSLAKSSAWKYEKEWRTISKAGVNQFPRCVKHVIIGVRISKETRGEILAAVDEAEHSIQVHEATMDSKKYALDFAPLVPETKLSAINVKSHPAF